MSIILNPNRHFITLHTHYKEHKNYIRIANPKDKGAQCLRTTWKSPTWGEQNAIVSSSLTQVNTFLEIDSIRYRELKLKACLKDWDAKDDEGNAIPLTHQAIDDLDPTISAELLRQFELAAEPSNKDLDELEKSMKRFYEGKKPIAGIMPQYIYEHLLSKYCHWSLSEIRGMDYYDFLVHLRLCMVSDTQDKEFEMAVQGKSTKKKLSADDIMKKKMQQQIQGE